MKLGRLSIMAAAGVMAAGAFAGTAGTSTASAESTIPTPLCIDSSTDGNVCLFNAESAGIGDRAFWSAGTAQVDWNYPNVPTGTGATGEIVGSVIQDCLQINASDSNFVRYATCNEDDAEKWINYYNPDTHRTEFVSFWALNDAADGFLCLSEDYNGGNRLVKADPCDPGGFTNYWYQQFGRS